MFDPTKPAPGDDLDAILVRNQLNSLKALIDAVPGITAVVVDAVNTLDPGQPAAVTASIIGTTLHLTLSLPRGSDGSIGGTGDPGPQGPPFAGVVVDGVNALPPGSFATVDVSFDGTNVHLTFGLPVGATGADGIQGMPGEVTTVQLNAAIADALSAAQANSSANTNAVATLDTPFANDPPTLADIEVLRAKINEIISTAHR
ncbi:MAG: hypothetical protein ABI318_08075 [Chthoniobacteraceae bacterium]